MHASHSNNMPERDISHAEQQGTTKRVSMSTQKEERQQLNCGTVTYDTQFTDTDLSVIAN